MSEKKERKFSLWQHTARRTPGSALRVRRKMKPAEKKSQKGIFSLFFFFFFFFFFKCTMHSNANPRSDNTAQKNRICAQHHIHIGI
jgi:hypothetical protein